MTSDSKNERSPLGFNEVELDDNTRGSATQAKVSETIEFDRPNSRGGPLNNQTLLTEDQAENRVDTDQVLSRSMQVTSQYVTNGAIAVQKGKGKGYEEFDFVADNSDSKSEAGASQS